MKKGLLFIAAVFFVTYVGVSRAADVSVGDNLRISNGGIEFEDASVQYTATQQGPQGPVGPQGDPGPVAGTDKQIVYNDNNTAAGAEVYYDKATGNVGIGSAPTNNKLEVNGNVSATTFSGDGSAVTNVNAGTLNGLAGTSYQSRVNGTCSVGSMISSINSDGTVVCATDKGSNTSAAAVSGIVTAPVIGTGWISPTVETTVLTGQTVQVTATAALGASSVAANGLQIYPCYAVGTAIPTKFGSGLWNLAVPPDTRIPFMVSGVFSLAAGTYKFGMCGGANTPANWNNNDWGYTSIIVLD